MPNIANTPEATEQAAKFAVPAEIHAEDFIYQHHLEVQPDIGLDEARSRVIEYYFLDGDRSAQRLDNLIRQLHPDAESRHLKLLEFASGYGCVSRHLRKMESCSPEPNATPASRMRLVRPPGAAPLR